MVQTNLIGKKILGYTVREKLGSGAFGTVYKAVKTNVAGQYVRALKHITIPTEKQYNSVLNSMGGDISKADNYFSEMLTNIISEIRILNDLSEKDVKYIVRYFENDIIVTDTPKRYDIFILMEYLTPLEDYISNNNFLVRDVMNLGMDILHGLQLCHNNGVIHRDIKDDNIFVSDKKEYKIGDFGVSKILKDSSKAESLKGTPNYLAPEVYLGKESYTKSVDLYSLGIVLYRLLNYNRNPFLPCFPEQYFTQDEDKAFEKRMSGKTPNLPALGGEIIGQIIVKAISNSSERYQSAKEFMNDLEMAINDTSPELLNQKIKMGEFQDVAKEEKIEEQYRSTIGEKVPQFVAEEYIDKDKSTSINKSLFESIGEVPLKTSPQVETTASSIHYYKDHSNSQMMSSDMNDQAAAIDATDLRRFSDPATADNKVMKILVFFIPIIILLIGAIAYFIVIPIKYGEMVSFIDWLFADPQNVIDTLHDSNMVIPKLNSIIGMKIFWWIWGSGLIISLFFVGKQLQAKPKPNSVDAILTKKEPYFKLLDITAELKLAKQHRSNKQLDALIYSVKKLEERLSVESDFGYGKIDVINCENDIARQIQYLLDIVPFMENGNIEENIKSMNTSVMNINSLLRKRTELKRR